MLRVEADRSRAASSPRSGSIAHQQAESALFEHGVYVANHAAQRKQNEVHELTAQVHRLEHAALLSAQAHTRELYLSQKATEAVERQLSDEIRSSWRREATLVGALAGALADAEGELDAARAVAKALAFGARAAGAVYAVRLFLRARRNGTAGESLCQ
jgi:hypothetical protein